MKTNKLEQAGLEVINDLKTDGKQMFNALNKYVNLIEEIKENSSLDKLPKLLKHLTAVTKRKTLETNCDFSRTNYNIYSKNTENVKIGLNLEGVGLANYGSQLTPIAEQIERDEKGLNALKTIVENEDLLFELSDEILSKHRKTFMKLCSLIKKSKIYNDKLDIMYSSKETDDEIGFTFNRIAFYVKMYVNGEGYSLNFKELLNQKTEKDNWNFDELSIKDFENYFLVTENTAELTKMINEKIKEITAEHEQNKELNAFIKDNIVILDAVENL